MTDALEAELDRLFQLPAAEMVEARNALADQLKKAGDKAAAARIKALKRPAPTAWALNQIHFRDPALLDRARSCTERLRQLQAQDGVQRDQLAAAVEAQRSAVQAVVDAAIRCCYAASVNAGPTLERKLLTTVQAWLAGTSEAAPGRMTQEIEPSGFDAIAVVGRIAAASSAPAPAPAPPPAAAPAKVTKPAPDPRAIADAQKMIQERQEAAQRAQESAARLRAERDAAQRELERAQALVRDTELELTRARKLRDDQATTLAVSKQAAEHAESEQRAANEALASARAQLAAIQRSS